MEDIIIPEKLILPVKGHAKIELFDSITGKKTYEQEGDNFIAPAMVNKLMRQVQKALFTHQCPNNGVGMPYMKTDSTGDGYLKYLILTDSADVESPTTETDWMGNMIGYADRFPYSGTDTLKGAINQNECYSTEERVHWVFDFATDRANGTIQSICWAYSLSHPQIAYYSPAFSSIDLTYLGRFVRRYSYMTYGDGYLWGILNSTLYKIDPYNYSEIATYTLESYIQSSSFCVRNGFVYYYYSSYWRRYDLSTGITTASTSSRSGGGYIAIDENYIYTTYNYSVTQWNISNFAPVTSKTFAPPGATLNNGLNTLVYINNNLYVSAYCAIDSVNNHRLYIWDYSNNTYALQDGIGSLSTTYFHDGTNLYRFYSESSLYNGTSTSTNTFLFRVNNGLNAKFYNLFARKRLDAPVIKTNSKTMKVTYDFIFN